MKFQRDFYCGCCPTYTKRVHPSSKNNDNMNYLQIPPKTTISSTPKAKIGLARGRSLMDWIRYMTNTPNISGTNGKLLQVTQEELCNHNTQKDCWIAIHGNVYNITPYLEYHPGGIDEIMRDGTVLFQEVHPWVNYSNMLEKCLVGRLIKPRHDQLDEKTKALNIQGTTANVERLSFDFFQNEQTVTLCIYTSKTNFLTYQDIIILLNKATTFISFIYIDDIIHTIMVVRIATEKGRIEIELKKVQHKIWKMIGNFTDKHLSYCNIKNFDPLYFSVTLMERQQITHDTYWLKFSLQNGIHMHPPIGYHIRLKLNKNDVSLVKPYTIIGPLEGKLRRDEKVIDLLVKYYSDGNFTPLLKTLEIGEQAEMSVFEGNFDVYRLETCKILILIAAGTGFSPMMRIINNSFGETKQNLKNVVLLFFNKTQNDILFRKELTSLSQKNKNKFIYHNILSRPDSTWTGETGYVRGELLKRLLPKHDKKDQTLICICGPLAFTKLAATDLRAIGYSDDEMHQFLA
ncbi:unnamed protein product [Didymodactylos carnosus]|uniref:Cytochrome-b5 reductase n=1 Tax=Didymodactylos carnosus TaxID=1234261 RepID=A0A8S2D9Q0_9BILA|nr:unnamed protein product [Didymodactylos carnosus]CAF3663084.1 unnamed protein product [Didymodactylos carnosus]